MKVWYKAVCDEHLEFSDLFVNNIECTYAYLLSKNDLINNFLLKHYGCSLRLIHHDLDLDEIYNKNYSDYLVNNLGAFKENYEKTI